MSLANNLKELWKSGDITFDQYKKQVEDTFISKTVDKNGDIIGNSPHDWVKQTADKTELKQIVQEETDYELNRLKNKQIRFDGEHSQFTNGNGEWVGKSNFNEMNRVNMNVRREAKKILGKDSEANRFMRAKSFDDYKTFRNKRNYKPPKNFSEAYYNVKNGAVPGSPSSVPDKGLKSLDTKTSQPEPPQQEPPFDIEGHIKAKARESLVKEDQDLRRRFGTRGIAALGDWNLSYDD